MPDQDDRTKEVVKSLAEITKEIAVPFYNDAISPAAKEVGKGLASLARMVNAGVYLAEDCTQTLAIVLHKTAEQLLILPPDQIVLEQPRIAATALEESRFAIDEPEIQDLFATLIASSMTKGNTDAHPSYVEIIKQLSSDEAKVLAWMGKDSLSSRVLVLEIGSEQGNSGTSNDGITPLFRNAQCAFPEKGNAYMVNLQRLSLTNESNRWPLDHYQNNDIFNSPEGKAVRDRMGEWPVTYVKRYFWELTTYGRSFIKACHPKTTTPFPRENGQ